MYFYKRNRFPYSWHDMDRFQREMNRYFEGQEQTRYSLDGNLPLMNVYTNEEDAIVTVELPGTDPEAIEISVVGETLTVSGERASEECSDSANYHRQERTCGKFNRSIQLPFPVEADKVEARMEKGLLSIRLPRAEEDKPRRITVRN